MKIEDKVEFVALTKEEIEEMIAKAALAGAAAATDTLERAHKKETREQKDRRLHNTRLLLRNYRMLKENCTNAVYNRERNRDITEAVIDDLMTMRDDKAIVASIKESSDRTAVILTHIDKMLDIYRTYCWKNTEKEKRQYQVIKYLHIAKNKMSVSDLAKKYGVSRVTIYDDIKIAEERISALLFGVDGMRFY